MGAAAASGKPDRAPVRVIDLTGLGDATGAPLEHAAWRQLLEDEIRPSSGRWNA